MKDNQNIEADIVAVADLYEDRVDEAVNKDFVTNYLPKDKTVIITDSHHIILCYLTYEKLASRLSETDVNFEEENDE